MSTKTDDETQLERVELPAEILEAVAREGALWDEARQLQAQALASRDQVEAMARDMHPGQCPEWCTVESSGDAYRKGEHQWRLNTTGDFVLTHSGTRKGWVIEAREFIERDGAHWLSDASGRRRGRA